MASRCLRAGTELAPIDSQRIVVAPEQMAVVARGQNDGALPREIAIGGAAGSPVVLLRFPTPWGHKIHVARAFVTLEPLPGALRPIEPFVVSVARILEPWSPTDVSWGRLPRLSPSEGSVSGGGQTLRIDVTAIVQRWTEGRNGDQGIALTTHADSASTASYASGTSGHTGPRLDVYLR